MELYRQMKRIAAEAATTGTKKLYYGTVECAEPLSVRVDQRFVLPRAFLTLTESVTELKDGDAMLRPGLAAGDRVILFSMGNSDYLILDRVV